MNREALERWINRGVADGVFPVGAAAVVFLEEENSPVVTAHAGALESLPVTSEDELLFDLASVTKPFVATAALRLIRRGQLGLSRPLGAFFPQLTNFPLGDATVEQLLSHEAGLEAWLGLFEHVQPPLRGTDAGKSQLMRLLFETQRQRRPAPAAVYSDLGYMLLGELLAGARGQSLAEVIARDVTGPLGLSSVSFRPVDGAAPAESAKIAPTEDCPWRGRVLLGEVHDDNAWTMGGTAGHAGLFGTVSDLARFGAGWLKALEGDAAWLEPGLARSAITVRPGGRTLCFDVKSPGASSAGSRMGARTFGHLGYTGCSLWIDPDLKLVVALATNRVRYGRDNTRIRAYRPWFHDELLKLVG